jgi:hypothetical protein
MDLESFKAASEAAESWVGAIADIRHFAQQGEARVAYDLLLDLSQRVVNQGHLTALREASDDLARVSDGIVRWYCEGHRQSYTSTHEAVTQIIPTLVLAFLGPLDGVTADKQEAIARRICEERAERLKVADSELTARIRRERANLLAWQESHNPPRGTGGTPKTPKKPGRKEDPDGDKKIAEQYREALDAGECSTQAEFVRKYYPKRTRSWLSSLLKRERGRDSSKQFGAS